MNTTWLLYLTNNQQVWFISLFFFGNSWYMQVCYCCLDWSLKREDVCSRLISAQFYAISASMVAKCGGVVPAWLQNKQHFGRNNIDSNDLKVQQNKDFTVRDVRNVLDWITLVEKSRLVRQTNLKINTWI